MKALTASFAFPTAVLFGGGILRELPRRLRQLGSRKPLVVTDPGLLSTRAFEVLKTTLDPHQLGQSWELFHGVHCNPLEEDVAAAAKAFQAAECDAIVAFGGGSALDVGKACRLLIKRPDVKLARFNFNDDWNGLARCVCIPTTAGSGSEVSRTVDIIMANSQRRLTLLLPRLLPKLVILDPELTLEMPPELTAATGMDALAHCIEAFSSPVFHPLCDGIALEAIHLIAEALPRAFADAKDLEARGLMQVAAAMGGVAMQKELGAAHSFTQPLSSICGMHHGTAIALALPRVMSFNAQRKPGLYRRVGLACGLEIAQAPPAEADQKTIAFIHDFVARLGLGAGLKSFNVKDSVIEALASQAFADHCHLTNPVPLNWSDFKSLYQAAL